MKESKLILMTNPNVSNPPVAHADSYRQDKMQPLTSRERSARRAFRWPRRLFEQPACSTPHGRSKRTKVWRKVTSPAQAAKLLIPALRHHTSDERGQGASYEQGQAHNNTRRRLGTRSRPSKCQESVSAAPGKTGSGSPGRWRAALCHRRLD
jgi:hypothetical protein